MGIFQWARGSRNRTGTLPATLCHARNVLAALVAVAICLASSKPAPGDPTDATSDDDADLSKLLDAARAELKTAEIPEKEIQLRLKIIENVATVKAYFPRAYGGRPEMRNAKYWTQDDEGNYIPRRKPTESIKDLWRTTSGIRCRKLSTLVMLKGLIDVSDSKQLATLNDMLQDKVIPNDLPDEGVGTLFEELDPKHGEVFEKDEFLAGDEVWFDNPYFEELSGKLQGKYRGQEGHHVFYIGDGKVMDMYGREPMPIDEFRETFLDWGSVETVAEKKKLEPKADDFQIKAVRRVIFGAKQRA